MLLSNSNDFTQEEFEYLLIEISFPKVLLYNINSIPHNLENFLNLTGIASNISSIEIMSFCETKLSDNIETLYKLKGYTSVTNNRHNHGGGVCMYLRNHISFSIMKEVFCSSDTVETVFFDAIFLKKRIITGVIADQAQKCAHS